MFSVTAKLQHMLLSFDDSADYIKKILIRHRYKYKWHLNAPVVPENNAPIAAVRTRVAPTFVVQWELTSQTESCNVR